MSVPTTDCEYIAHDEGVHEFIFHKSSRNAIDFFMEHVRRVFNEAPIETGVLTIIDLTESGIPPLRYAMERSKSVTNQYFENRQDAPQQHDAYIAMITNNPLIQTFKFFMERLARGKTHIKVCTTREEAFDWLMSQKSDAVR